ncbi:aspartyl-phosphate phosphatase Spo0E family protein [Desulfosporosinus nitroreducens]|uniref:Aspartyl-phosphate phosphatase Spo0E family protein n=1 Tax=Desulfosporosinus nitroreducens TaxID=2018668 RepID=A0ABT8QQE4_9FIRM|nr:aspartyl-phosphate phosphatase Spo0E family protein [Desulfosporosinus nitroreducens]MCO1604065.1 aspartyl-phosphate phosphatase Spo0E family protein [Desulfosporosinus nitroreducens]MDO0823566.1 aspartyl-phosphate phosphatase Spo0E family protein [Desulfosporosinus nitroreducens]
MSELDEIVNQIEELRSSTIKVKEDKCYTNLEVVAACHELHTALDRYQGILMRVKEEDK